MFLEEKKRFLEQARQYLIISRRVINPFTLRDLKSAVHSGNHSLVTLIANQANVPVRFRESLNNLNAPVSGRIVDDDNFEWLD